MKVHQIRSTDGTGTLSYILVDKTSHRAIVIDPNKEDCELLIARVKELRASLEYVIDTHTHADHISGADELRKEFNAKVVMHENTVNKWKSVDQGDAFGIGDILRANAKIEIDRYVKDGDTLLFGNSTITILFTPGHTDNHISVLAEGNLFTGDLLLIGQAGRSDLPGGNPEEQFESLTKKILPLPDSTKIYPGHDYQENEFALLGGEKRSNPFLQHKTKEDFLSFVKDFFPPIADSVEGGKMILQCGVKRITSDEEELFKHITPDQLEVMIQKNPSLAIIDVREPKELAAFGHIPNVVNISSKQIAQRLNELPANKSKEIVVVCQTGGRSFEVAHLLTKNGYANVFNLEGGTTGWMMSGKKVERN